MRRRAHVLCGALVAFVLLGGAVAAATPRMQLVGKRTAVAGAAWRATLIARPAPRSLPRVSARNSGVTTRVRVRRTGAGRYSLNAAFPSRGRWPIVARAGRRRHALGTVTVGAPAIRLQSAYGLALQPDGGVLIADGDAHRVVRLDLRSGRMTTFAAAALVGPTDVDVARDGTVYVADRLIDAVFRIRGGIVSRLDF